jgi:hypothetical protein
MSKRRELTRLRAAAEAGDMAAAGELSEILMDDDDLTGAEHWSRMAASSGDITGQLVLGLLLDEKGKYEEGVSWLKAAASSKDPEFARPAGMAATCLWRSLLERIIVGRIPAEQQNLDEVEHWMKIADAAGYAVAQEDLELLERTRRGGVQGGAGQGSGGDVLKTFEVRDVTFYDGSEHRLGPSTVSFTRKGVIIDDARGGINQILLRDIRGVNTPARLTASKLLRVTTPGVAYDFWCKSKDQRELLEDWLTEGVRYAASGGP